MDNELDILRTCGHRLADRQALVRQLAALLLSDEDREEHKREVENLMATIEHHRVELSKITDQAKKLRINLNLFPLVFNGQVFFSASAGRLRASVPCIEKTYDIDAIPFELIGQRLMKRNEFVMKRNEFVARTRSKVVLVVVANAPGTATQADPLYSDSESVGPLKSDRRGSLQQPMAHFLIFDLATRLWTHHATPKAADVRPSDFVYARDEVLLLRFEDEREKAEREEEEHESDDGGNAEQQERAAWKGATCMALSLQTLESVPVSFEDDLLAASLESWTRWYTDKAMVVFGKRRVEEQPENQESVQRTPKERRGSVRLKSEVVVVSFNFDGERCQGNEAHRLRLKSKRVFALDVRAMQRGIVFEDDIIGVENYNGLYLTGSGKVLRKDVDTNFYYQGKYLVQMDDDGSRLRSYEPDKQDFGPLMFLD